MGGTVRAWGVRRMPSTEPQATFATRDEAEDWMRGGHYHDSNVLIHVDGAGGWRDVTQSDEPAEQPNEET